MSLADLLTVEGELLLRAPSPSPDADGVQTWTETPLPVLCELQQEIASEANGAMLETTLWRLFLPATVAPRGWDALRLPGDGVMFELEGDAWAVRNPRSGQVSHVEARVRRVE